MPTVKYAESMTAMHKEILAEWKAQRKTKRGDAPKLVLIPALKDVTITYPDVWLWKHADIYELGRNAAPEGSSDMTQRIYGAIALCDKIDGVKIEGLSDLPIYYRLFFSWLANEVLTSYFEAFNVPNE